MFIIQELLTDLTKAKTCLLYAIFEPDESSSQFSIDYIVFLFTYSAMLEWPHFFLKTLKKTHN